ncbi:MAG: NAD(P)H-dependent oxidoreductase [Alphaproteobacteria bacterium]|nr:NAD(P)H-dependent oxidoreductase [Alphaproteobacteria bacterium]
MSSSVKLVAFSGSSRKESFNTKLLVQAVAAARAVGAEVTVVELAAYDMPIYDGDDEAASGLPAGAVAFKKLLRESDGILIASPEYNSAYSALLKNAIDWASRSGKDEPPGSVFAGKFAGILSASPGALGGLRGLFALRELLQNLGVTVLPSMQAVGQAMTAFNDDGTLKDEKTAAGVAGVAGGLVSTLQKIKA